MSDSIIYSYTRKDAISDGILIDVTSMARDAGIKYPVAITDTLYNGYIKPSSKLEECGQSLDGRLWDTLFLFTFHARKAEGDTIYYSCLYLMNPEREAEEVNLKAVIGPGDTPEPVITLMLPDED